MLNSIFRNKRIWVVGASGTIGGAIAKKFKDEGAYVFGERVELLDYVDIINRGATIRPDILVNCAGVYGPHEGVQDGLAIEWAHTININLIGSYYLTRAALPHMLKQNSGKIIHMSGGGAAYGRPFYSAYAASKAGLARFVECVAEEVEGYNIQINAIAPGSVKSRMNPEGTGTPDKAVELALYLASQESNHLTGRLISAIHDDWKKPFSKEGGKLRRIGINE